MNDIDITESSKLMMKQMRQRLRWLIESRDLSQRSISSNVSDSEAYIQNSGSRIVVRPVQENRFRIPKNRIPLHLNEAFL